MDLLNSEEEKKIKTIISYYQNVGYEIVENTDTKQLKKLIKEKTVVIAGQSGAGKSQGKPHLCKCPAFYSASGPGYYHDW